ncbi:MAG: DUF998 domain-containing protein [Ignisphaera sp.]|uniref:DUF998 domain-containing protein n=1 Tax=Ignisphaera aggregans TaxID=334771 RepID=A0A7C4JKL2_9CREN
MKKYLLAVPLASIVIPLICIAISATLSPWFNIVNNALSDLGHAINSNVSPIFNFGLSLGGSLIIIVATTIILRYSKALTISLTLNGYTLILVAVFDEVYNKYGRLHFWVSVAFFISLAISLIVYSIITPNKIKKIVPLILLTITITSWILHLFYKIPRGAAIPELISIFAVAPFYIDATLKSIKIEKHH